jgi:hypothetical protein
MRWFESGTATIAGGRSLSASRSDFMRETSCA